MGFICTRTELTFQHVQVKANRAADVLSRQLHNPDMTSKQTCSNSSLKNEYE